MYFFVNFQLKKKKKKIQETFYKTNKVLNVGTFSIQTSQQKLLSENKKEARKHQKCGILDFHFLDIHGAGVCLWRHLHTANFEK